jgi:hypothetical protein
MADRLRVTELDFDTIKLNLKTFLNQQSQFTDYDFEGSGLNVLLDILAYNTHYNAYYLNMVANESFLDSALLRDSVVSHAKTLGYLPHSMKAPNATINFLVNAPTSTDGTLTIPSGYSFLSNQIDSKVYNFVVLEDTTVTKANNSYYFENLNISEGQLITYSFNHNQTTNPKQTFTLPDNDIDTTSIKVGVSPTSTTTDIAVYNLVTDILDVTNDSQVYYLQETKNGQYQIYFGNNVIGKTLPDGAVVSVTYLVTNGTSANKANNFVGALTLTDSLNETLTNFTVTPVSAASGGAERESVDDIKFGSAAQFATQNRLITTKDYESYIRKNYPAVDSISVWGGEEETPRAYGKVFVSLKPKEDYYISETEKKRILTEIIAPKAIVSVETIIRDPEYLYLLVSNYVQYNKNKTTQNAEGIKNSIKNSILLYNQTFLNKFGATFVLSKLQDSIDGVDLNAILGSETILRLQKRFEPDLTISASYVINFNSVLHRGTLTNRMTSTEFDVFDRTGTRRTVILEEVPQSYTGVSSVQVTNRGAGFITNPTVTITGDGVGATATATIVNGGLDTITITNRGSGYTRAVATLSGGDGGYGASALVILDARYGNIRTIYFDALSQRQVVNENVGTIDYNSGTITLNDLRILSVVSTDGLIRLTIESERGIVTSNKSTIITIDPTDTNAITTNLVEIE